VRCGGRRAESRKASGGNSQERGRRGAGGGDSPADPCAPPEPERHTGAQAAQRRQASGKAGARTAGRKASMRDSRYAALWAVDCTGWVGGSAREGRRVGQAASGLAARNRKGSGECASPQSSAPISAVAEGQPSLSCCPAESQPAAAACLHYEQYGAHVQGPVGGAEGDIPAMWWRYRQNKFGDAHRLPRPWAMHADLILAVCRCLNSFVSRCKRSASRPSRAA
jgi:hypothetical protein